MSCFEPLCACKRGVPALAKEFESETEGLGEVGTELEEELGGEDEDVGGDEVAEECGDYVECGGETVGCCAVGWGVEGFEEGGEGGAEVDEDELEEEVEEGFVGCGGGGGVEEERGRVPVEEGGGDYGRVLALFGCVGGGDYGGYGGVESFCPGCRGGEAL